MKNRFKKFLTATALVAGLAAGIWAGFGNGALAGGETRTISLYHIHTKERLNVTYMVNGRYVPSAMKKIDYFMRDWRANKAVKMDPKTIDLIWELHADLGSKQPIHVVCGLRTAKTNSFLKRIGRGVAKKSQHTLGKAIDIYFPDVPTKKMRNSALVRKVGGVGYYRRSAGPTGFLHVDSGKVRHWGPKISQREMAQIFRDYKKTVGARRGSKGFLFARKVKEVPAPEDTAVAASAQAPEVAYEGNDEDLAELTEAASKAPEAPKTEKVPEPSVSDIVAFNVPKPRSKPLEVLALAAMRIEPASAPPEKQNIRSKPSMIQDSLGVVDAAASLIEEPSGEQVSNASAKTSFAASVREGTAENIPLIKPLSASLSGYDPLDMSEELFRPERAVRQDGAPQAFSDEDVPLLPSATELQGEQQVAPGKSDRLIVNRDGKGGLPDSLSIVLQGRKKIGQLN